MTNLTQATCGQSRVTELIGGFTVETLLKPVETTKSYATKY